MRRRSLLAPVDGNPGSGNQVQGGHCVGRLTDRHTHGGAAADAARALRCPQPSRLASPVRSMRVHGHCHCGKIRYEAEVDETRVNLCNCTDCQVITGSAFRVSVPVDHDQFKLLSGTPRLYVKTAESGTRRRHYFCADCGTPVAATADLDDPPAWTLRIGCLEERPLLPPRSQTWCRSSMPWLNEVASLPWRETG